MPFIVELPPVSFQDENTKIEYIIFEGQNHIYESDLNFFRVEEDMFENVYFQEKFNLLISNWKSKTAFHSSISKIIEDKNFIEMLKMNRKKLFPLIIDEIERQPSILVWALNIISGQSLSTIERYTITDVCKKWVDLYRQGKINII